MSRPRFLADNDVRQAIVSGLVLREPLIEFARCRDLGLDVVPDERVLATAAEDGLIVVSHDLNTMRAVALSRVASGLPMCGLLLVEQSQPIRPVIDDLLMIWSASEAEEWDQTVRNLPL